MRMRKTFRTPKCTGKRDNGQKISIILNKIIHPCLAQNLKSDVSVLIFTINNICIPF